MAVLESNKNKSESADENGSVGSFYVFDDVPSSVASLASTGDGANGSSQSTSSSWDLAESTSCSAGTQTDDASTKATTTTSGFRLVELEQEIALLKTQMEILRAENEHKADTIDKQREQIDSLEKIKEKCLCHSFLLGVKESIIQQQREKIQDLLEKLEERTNGQDVTVQFYEAEEEIATLRDEKGEACKIIQELLYASNTIHGENLQNGDGNPVTTFTTLMKGWEVFSMEELQIVAHKFAIHVLADDPYLAVDFLANACMVLPASDTTERIREKCLEIIRSNPSMLLETKQTDCLDARCIEAIVKDQCMQADELTLFRVLHHWYLAEEETREEIFQNLVQYIKLQHIDPVELATTVRSTGLVSDTLLCDAYGMQAENKNLLENFHVVRAFACCNQNNTIGAELKEVETAPTQSLLYASADWGEAKSDILSGDKENGSAWITDMITSQPFRQNGTYSWKIGVEETGEVIFGLTNASYCLQEHNVTQFGSFLPRRHFAKGTIVCFRLKIKGSTKRMSTTIDGEEWISDMAVNVNSAVVVTACVRYGASVKFLGIAIAES
ncbi:BTB Ketch domain containing protein [Nitzschia inconspicua]|uniref:BTB Ketch domain containing protein n=1 Tax=Nitzschia inconspicua TaxID=303405 RepID=A0A9K3PTV2_9STRA|nr:BTB Ketch domain containing protein [Nitzschia inconspicua]